MNQSQLDYIANEAARDVTLTLCCRDDGQPESEITAAIRALILAEIAAAIPGILRTAGVLIKP